MEIICKVKKIGGSLMIRIPKDLSKIESVQEGQLLKIKMKRFRQSGFGLIKDIKIEKEHIKGSDFE